MSKPLFSEFSPVSAKAFKQKIQYDLDGAEYNETLVWNSAEGISVKPFYHREETQALPIPGQPKTWSIAEEIFILKAATAAATAKNALNKGAEALLFKAENKFDIAQLLEQLPQQELVLYF
ncbi:MAG TPA: methylmalonyl-CoA mutase, partial [Leeuwenhoekiella sp.]|nr:methylmalonyl-CoA mutase [Leeuwenhoekiella sp.]